MEKANKEVLNRLGKEWYEAEPQEKVSLASRIFEMAYKLFPRYGDVLGEFFLQDWPGFNPEVMSLHSFMTQRLEYRHKTAEHTDREEHRLTKEDGTRAWVSSQSFNAPFGEDEEGNEATLADLYKDERPGAEGINALIYNDTAVQFLNLALSLPERLNGRANNKSRLTYFRMFFTDNVVEILHKGLDEAPFAAHERELFGGAMKTEFLDFFMAAICRRVREICLTPEKPYGEMVEGRPMEPPEHPLPIDVYLTYLKDWEGLVIHAASTISNQRNAYAQFMRESLGR